jgi:hypothetical protein
MLGPVNHQRQYLTNNGHTKKMPVAGTLSHLGIYIVTNNIRTNPSAYTLRKNATTSGTFVFSVTASTTGQFNDRSHS